MLTLMKSAVLGCAKGIGAFRVARSTRWRNQHLAILCYHGVSLRDEHGWNAGLYIPEATFRDRMRYLRESGFEVLPLAVGIRRLYANDLPPRSVCITFDDGFYDFYHHAFPILKEHNFPATVYLTTYYAERPAPIFNLCCSYLLWKGRGRVLESGQTGLPLSLDLSTTEKRAAAVSAVNEFVEKHNVTWQEKDELARKLAGLVGVDYERFKADRVLQLMNASEVKAIASGGIDIQLHTHRHRSPLREDEFVREIRDNRESITAMTGGSTPVHFCYPSGILRTEFPNWLSKCGVQSAVTCDAGLAGASDNPLLLPRLLDSSCMSSLAFESWLSGLGTLLPRRRKATIRRV